MVDPEAPHGRSGGTRPFGRTRRVHFVGVGGIGMSGIAEVLVNLGYVVTGSDVRASDLTARLASRGVRVKIGHDPAHVGEADVVVVSAAVPSDNPEVGAARARRIPVIPRAEMLAELMRLRAGIAVAGSHGKTTTTSMVALVMERAGLDPTVVIGGRLSAFGGSAKLGYGHYMVAEADESDRSFLKLSPTIAVVTNIDREHLDAYGTLDGLVEAFAAFADRVPFYGAAIACIDDPTVAALVPSLSRRVLTYGFAADAEVRGIDAVLDGQSGRCRVAFPAAGAEAVGELILGVPGRHNLQNALGAVAVGLELGMPFDRIRAALAEFRGAERRYQPRGTARGVSVVDDYAHHPTEIAAVLAAARAGRPARVVAVFQPHRYSRTRDLVDAFGPALAGADVVVLTDVYPAGEAPIAGASLADLASRVRQAVPDLRVVPRLADVPHEVARLVQLGDLVLTLGAGSIDGVADRILAALVAAEVES